MTNDKSRAILNLAIVVIFAALVNWVSYQFYPDYSGPITATLTVLLCTTLLWRNHQKWSDLGLRRLENPSKLLWQVPLVLVSSIAALAITNQLLSLLIEIPAPVQQSRFEGMAGNVPMFLMWVAYGWIVGGFMEEMIFRGFILNHVLKIFEGSKSKVYIAVFSQAFLFGLVHFYNRGIFGALMILIAGMVIGFLYIKFGKNLWPMILAHGIMDTLSFLEDFLA